MTLARGTRIGSYEVVGLLGAGGMGEVYRATDTRLKREVALKVLPAHVANDRERLARFQREAEVLASLNHPHIAQVYGLEDGALVMELVDGDDLSQRIGHGAIPADEALLIAKQIAGAIEAAHEAGVIHRDLKPANIKVRADGTVKVLDFGLAKALDHSPTHSTPNTLANSPTITSPDVTGRGVILGTAAYMSPEQARGKPVDRRTDVWAFGVILFEMLTGQRPFKGETVSDSVAAILKTDPDWNALPADTPFLIKRLLRHCLNRDPRERLGDIRDARIEITEALAEPAGEPMPAPRRARLPWAIGATSLALVAGLVGAFAGGVAQITPAVAEPQVIRFSLSPPDDVRSSLRPVVSPDGRHVAFMGASRNGIVSLWVHSLSTAASRQIPGTERILAVASAFWSPDSRSIGFFADGKLKRVDLDQGAPVVIGDAVNGRGGTWNQDGEIIFSLTAGPLLRVKAAGGTQTPLTKLDAGSRSHRVPHFLPDGRHFVFMAIGGAETRLLLGSLDDSSVRELRVIETLAGIVPPDLVLFTTGGQLMAQQLDVVAGGLVGDRMPVGEVGATPTQQAWASASAGGVLVYRRNPTGDRVVLAWVDRRGAVTRLPLAPGAYGDPGLSPDGRQLALSIRDESGEHIWVYDLARGSLGKRTFDDVNSYPIWSRDGTSLTFSRGNGQNGPLQQVAADGSGRAAALVSNESQPGQKIATSWSEDGQLLAFQFGQDVLVRARDGAIRPALVTGAFEREARFAPNGRWMAYRSNETGRDEVYVQSYPTGGGKWQISTEGGAQPMWSPDGKELFYKSGDRMMAVAVALQPTFKAGVPRLLFQMPLPERTIGDPSRYAVSPDGQRFLVTTTDDGGAAEDAPVHVMLNWRTAIGRPRQ